DRVIDQPIDLERPRFWVYFGRIVVIVLCNVQVVGLGLYHLVERDRAVLGIDLRRLTSRSSRSLGRGTGGQRGRLGSTARYIRGWRIDALRSAASRSSNSRAGDGDQKSAPRDFAGPFVSSLVPYFVCHIIHRHLSSWIFPSFTDTVYCRVKSLQIDNR